MHELGIVFHMIKTVERIAEENVLTSVSSVTLELCENCTHTYPTVPQGRVCPLCGSEETVLLQGNEINLKEIEAC